jgi:hypothetical protein
MSLLLMNNGELANVRVIVGHCMTQWSKQNPQDLTPEAYAAPLAVTSSLPFLAGEFGSLE